MTELEKLFKDIQNQLNDEKIKLKRLKICKYSFEISKVAILSVATGLSFKHNSNVDIRLNLTKSKKDLLKELLNYKSTTYKELNENEINHLYDKLTNKLSVINTF